MPEQVCLRVAVGIVYSQKDGVPGGTLKNGLLPEGAPSFEELLSPVRR